MKNLELTFSEKVVKVIIMLSQFTPFRGNKNTISNTNVNDISLNALSFNEAESERKRFEDIFYYFPKELLETKGKNILDFGSGYDGRTLEYAIQGQAQSVIGVEPFESMVKKSNLYAKYREAEHCCFKTCDQLTIPASDSEFDLVISFDVLEHVQNPLEALKEMHRVLKPGGKAFIIFTPYLRPISHHLNYITRLPCLHWFFKPKTLINAINAILASKEGWKFNTAPQPIFNKNYNDKDVLPTLNGLTGREFLNLSKDSGFVIEFSRFTFVTDKYLRGGGWYPVRRLFDLLKSNTFIREYLVFNLACIIRKI